MYYRKKQSKQRVLISGANFPLVESLYAVLSDEFALSGCAPEKDELCRAASEFQPDLILVCLKNETKAELDAYAELRNINATYNKPFLAIGDPEEQERLAVRLEQKSVFGVNVNFTAAYLADRIHDVVFNCDASDIDVFTARELAVEDTDEKSGRLGLRKPHLLIIDDELKTLRSMKSRLTPKYKVTAVSDVTTAATVLERDKTVDTVLLDYTLDEQVTAPRIVKLIKQRYKLPVLVLVKMTDPPNLEKTFEVEPEAYFLKPVKVHNTEILDNPMILDEKIITLLQSGRCKLTAKIPD